MKNKKIVLTSVIFLVSFMLVFVGCESSTNEPSAETGSLLVKVTDDPFPVDFVESTTVTVNKIEVRKKDDSDENPYVVISEEVIDFNLLELRNGITTELPEIEIPVGSYDLVRLYVQSAKIVLNDGLGEFDLNVPSGAETGIKIFIDPELQIQGGLTAELLLDFDLSNSFVAQGNMNSPSGIKGFNFKPVIRAVNNQLAGSISGNVSDVDGALEGVLVTVTLDEESATAVTDSIGMYKIIGLKEGSYSVKAEFAEYLTEETSGVSIVANQQTEQNFILTK